MTSNPSIIGFMGIGLMGEPMTLRLLEAGFPVNVWNRSADKLSKVTAAGAKPFANAADLVEASEIIILCLADTTAVKEVAEKKIFPYASHLKLLIDLSSIHPQITQQLAQQLQQSHKVGWVDAPVSGGTAGAQTGSLAVMAGGAEQDIAIARQVLEPLYKQLTHMGAVGSGQISKICNQMIVSCNVMVIAEMMALAKQAGINAERLPEALVGGFADSKPLQIVAPEMASETFEPVKWRVKTLLKDLNMAVDVAGRLGNAIPVSALAAQLMQLHGAEGYLEQDPATLIKLYDKK